MISAIDVAQESRLHDEDTKLLHIRIGNNDFDHKILSDLKNILKEGDIIVINDSGVIPASFEAKFNSSKLEIRLVNSKSSDFSNYDIWDCLIYTDGGNWSLKTEERKLETNLKIGEQLDIGDDFVAKIIGISPISKNIYTIQFKSSSNVLEKFYAYGKLIQYSYLNHALDLWDSQTIFSAQPVSIEASSASFQFTWNLILSLALKGIKIVPLTHAIGISSTGDEIIDKKLPFPEKYFISKLSSIDLNNAIKENKRIIALGTSVMRSLESNFENNSFTPGYFDTNLKIQKEYERKIVSGLITGMHIPDESHFELLQSFISVDLIMNAYNEAQLHNYKWHEYGDLTLLL